MSESEILRSMFESLGLTVAVHEGVLSAFWALRPYLRAE